MNVKAIMEAMIRAIGRYNTNKLDGVAPIPMTTTTYLLKQILTEQLGESKSLGDNWYKCLGCGKETHLPMLEGEKVLSYKEGNEAYDNGVKMGRYLQKQIEYLKSWCPVCLNRECRCNQIAKRKIEEYVSFIDTMTPTPIDYDIRTVLKWLDKDGE